MKRILITAFDAFGKHEENPSEKLLDSIESKNVIKLILPTIYGTAENRLISAIKRYNPSAILLLGYSKSAKPIKLELVARNRDSKIAKDNYGKTGAHSIVKDGPETIDSTLPIGNITQQWDQEGITYTLSENAGGFLCNHVSYLALHWLKAHNQTTVSCGFMHIGRSGSDIAEARKAMLSMIKLLQ